MVIVDAGNLFFRTLYIAIQQVKPKKDDNGKYITKQFERQFFHLTLSSLMNTRMEFLQNFGEMVLTNEGKSLWRKEFYPEYKAHRKKSRDESEINFKEVYDLMDTFIKFIDENTPIKVVQVPEAEGDDIIAVLTEEYHSKTPILIDSVDHDFIQLLQYDNVTLRNPIKKTITKAPPSIDNFKLEHIICGDKGDNVPNIFYGSEYTDTFKKHLIELGIDPKIEPIVFEKLENGEFANKIYSDYNIFKTNRKGEELCEKDIYKMIPCGPKKAEKIIPMLNEMLKQESFAKNFERNSTLVLFEKIPKEVYNKIVQTFKDANDEVNILNILGFAGNYSLIELSASSSQFLIKPPKHLSFESIMADGALEEWM